MPTIHIHHAICYYYSARKLMLIYHPKGVEGQVDLSTKGAQPCPRLHIAVAVMINTTVHGEI